MNKQNKFGAKTNGYCMKKRTTRSFILSKKLKNESLEDFAIKFVILLAYFSLALSFPPNHSSSSQLTSHNPRPRSISPTLLILLSTPLLNDHQPLNLSLSCRPLFTYAVADKYFRLNTIIFISKVYKLMFIKW